MRLACSSALAAATLFAPTVDASPQRLPGARRPAGTPGQPAAPRLPGAGLRSLLIGGGGSSQNYGPWQVRTSQASSGWIARVAIRADIAPLLVPGIGGTALVLSVIVPSTQTEEFFTLLVPDSPAGVERPLLACFHGFGVSHLDIAFNTSFLAEADQRDWFLIAPFQVSTAGNAQINYASTQSQEHVEAVINWVMQRYDVDSSRMYGVGFSMGGGSALSYAARHRDRATGAFAAVVNHTGTVALSDVYANALPSVQLEMELIFGGPPSQRPFEYQRSSVIDLDASGAVIPGGRHMAQNLMDVPVRTYYGIGDPQQQLIDQCMELDTYMQALPGAQHELLAVPSAACGHCWDTIDETEVCDWFATHSLPAPPTAGTVLADRSGLWGMIDIEAALPDRFTAIDYRVEVVNNGIVLERTDNLLRAAFDIEENGLDPHLPLKIITGTLDGSGDRIVVRGLGAYPSSVKRNGIPVMPFCGPSPAASSWCYDAALQALEINEIGSASADWQIVP